MAAAKQCDCCKAYYTPKAAPAVLVKIDLHYQGELVPDLCPPDGNSELLTWWVLKFSM